MSMARLQSHFLANMFCADNNKPHVINDKRGCFLSHLLKTSLLVIKYKTVLSQKYADFAR